MKITKSSTNGTSFHDVVIRARVEDLISVLGEPTIQDNTGEYKTNFEWDCETEDGEVFSIYDWKEYRKLDLDEEIEFHIGSHSNSVSNVAFDELKELLK